ncbi:MAG TPA: FAD-dependent oxidoreductase [Galbitalea sp.]|jgi:2-polyprenyl-6-methoxyphenol hydroxylase-like FAD-dependent oxidoreductase|nr:FAD-dependent oxidoreductase [Galbitalea sp.]
MSVETLSTQCCIAGGGPAGMMLGLLLARAGVDVLVLEKHSDFFRDFRGDTIHPSTLDLLDQLGLRERFDALKPTSLERLDMVLNGTRITPINFGLLRRGNHELAFMPQWDFLKLLADVAAQLPHFRLLMDADATGLIRDSVRVVGATVSTPDRDLRIMADLTVAADGRASTLRTASGLEVREFGVPLDVLWFRLPRPEVSPPDTLGYITPETLFITIPRVDYYQTAMIIQKDGFAAIRAAGLQEFRAKIARSVPFLESVTTAVTSWDEVKLLSVQINRLDRWYLDGFLCIGDAAHAMSPAFGVGINYAIQDAVAAANILAASLRNGTLTADGLARVQRRRLRPAARMQSLQLALHNAIGKPGGGAILPSPLPRLLRVFLAIVIPPTRLITARVIGRGFRPERISSALLSGATPVR